MLKEDGGLESGKKRVENPITKRNVWKAMIEGEISLTIANVLGTIADAH